MIRIIANSYVKRANIPIDQFSKAYSPDDAAEVVQKTGHTYYEYLSGDACITKLYLDRDVAVEPGVCIEKVMKSEEEAIKHRLDKIAHALQGAAPNVFYRIATRHGQKPDGEYKLSFRPYFSGVSFRYTEIPAFLKYMDEDDGFWDMSVYTRKERLLGCINGTKTNKCKRKLVPQDPADDLKWYLAQYVEDSWPLADFSNSKMAEHATSVSVSGATANSDTIIGEGVANALAHDAGLMALLQVRAPLAFRHERHDPYFNTSQMYIDKKCGAACPIAKRVHKSNNATINVSFGNRSVVYHCFDPECCEVTTALDVTQHVQCVDAIFKDTIAPRKRGSGLLSVAGPLDACVENVKAEVISRLVDKWPERFHGKLHMETFHISKEADKTRSGANGQRFLLLFADTRSGIRGTIFPDYSVQVEGDTWKLLGELSPGMCMRELGRLHKDIHQHTMFSYTRDTETDTALLKGTGIQDNASITIMSPFSGDPHVRVKVDGRQSKVTKKEAEWLMGAITASAQQHAAKAHGLTLFQMNFNGPTTIVTGDACSQEFPALRLKLIEYADKLKLRKKDGIVYVPVPGCPCGYVKWGDYEEYINTVLIDDEVFHNNPRRYDDALKYLTNYRPRQFPLHVYDTNLISFSNGVLRLDDGSFIQYADIDEDHAMKGLVARHHIDQPFTGSSETPLLDKVLLFQFGKEVADVLCALFGRTLFQVGQLDNWQVMPYLVGLGGTGKSVLLKILHSFFRPGAIGNLPANREEVFGMANFLHKELVIGRDMPAKLSNALSQEQMQCMTSGEEMGIARKGTTAIDLTWTIPVVMASNHMPDYTNTGNNVGRRLVTFRFDKVVSSPQEDLVSRIQSDELPNIICRCLASYHEMQRKVKEVGSFWKAVPKTMLDWQSKLAAATNKLHEFLAMEPDERGCLIEQAANHVTWVHDFKAAFETKMGHGSFKLDPSVFHTFGYTVSDKLENVCQSCRQLARSRGGKCCENYDSNRRGKKAVIYNMKLTQIDMFSFI